MIEKLRELESRARVLDPPAAERRALLEGVSRHSEAFLEGIESMPAYLPPDDNGGKISDFPISEDAANLDELLGLLRDHVDHGRELPGIPPVPIAVIESQPGLVEIDREDHAG